MECMPELAGCRVAPWQPSGAPGSQVHREPLKKSWKECGAGV